MLDDDRLGHPPNVAQHARHVGLMRANWCTGRVASYNRRVGAQAPLGSELSDLTAGRLTNAHQKLSTSTSRLVLTLFWHFWHGSVQNTPELTKTRTN